MSRFHDRKQISQYWFNKASDLFGSAAALWISSDSDIGEKIVERADLGKGFNMAIAVGPVYWMLCGMALELLFKAITVERNLPVDDSHHDLIRHLSTASVTYSKKEKDLLKILSHSIAWEGRYPVPKKEVHWDDFQNLIYANLFNRVPLGKMTTLQRNEDLTWKSFRGLWGKALNVYFSLKEA